MCTICEEWKEETFDNFYMINKSKPELGLTPGCRVCLIDKARENRNNNIERARKWNADHYLANKQAYNDRHQAHREYNREHNREKMISDHERFVKKNPDRIREYSKNKRKHDISKEEWDNCLEIFGCECAYCGITEEEHLRIYKQKLHKEHVVSDGYNDLRNSVPSCKRCNSYKHQHDMEDWYRKQEFFSETMLQFIKLWMAEGYKDYIEDKLPYRVVKKKDGNTGKFYHQLWSVDEMRNTIEVIATKIKKKDLKEDIKDYMESYR